MEFFQRAKSSFKIQDQLLHICKMKMFFKSISMMYCITKLILQNLRQADHYSWRRSSDHSIKKKEKKPPSQSTSREISLHTKWELNTYSKEQEIVQLPRLVLYCIDGGGHCCPMHCDLFEIYCAPSNLGITRTWICRLNFAQRPIFFRLDVI